MKIVQSIEDEVVIRNLNVAQDHISCIATVNNVEIPGERSTNPATPTGERSTNPTTPTSDLRYRLL